MNTRHWVEITDADVMKEIPMRWCESLSNDPLVQYESS